MKTENSRKDRGGCIRWRSLAAYVCGVGLLVAGGVMLGGCEEFAADQAPVPRRAVKPPVNRNTGEGEALSGTTGNLNFLTVDFGNNRNEPPKVHSIVDDIREATNGTAGPATSQPAAQNATAAPTTQPASPTMFKVAWQQNPLDQFSFSLDNEGNARLYVFSASGVGSVILERTGEFWPAVLHVSLSTQPGKPFNTLEKFSAAEVLATDRRVELKTKSEKSSPDADVIVPGFTRAEKISISWVDLLRK